MMGGTFGIRMNQPMKLRRSRQREGRQPEQKHYCHSHYAAALMPGCYPKLHAMDSVTEIQSARKHNLKQLVSAEMSERFPHNDLSR
jgi:ABC-type sulfate transport system substrate-binding protein